MRAITRTSAEWLAEVYVPRGPEPETHPTPGSDTSTLVRNASVMVVGIVIVIGVWAVAGAVLPA